MKVLGPEDVGNWKEADNFGWSGRPGDADDRALVYTHNRDSGILDRCNAEIISEAMKPFIEDGSVTDERHHHWACGWIEGYSILVLKEIPSFPEDIKFYPIDGKFYVLTAAAEKWNKLAERMDDYPVLDDSAYSQAIDDAIQKLDAFDCRCIAEDHLGISDASEMTEEEIRALPDFYDKAMEWVEE
jgi:hypothetical protein